MRLVGALIERTFRLAKRINSGNFSPLQHQQKTLRRLLKKAANTAFGEHYHFRDLLYRPALIDAFRQQVPLHDYNSMHDQWWHRALKNEPDVTWKGKIKYFALSSGTTGSPSKYIPVTTEMIRAIRNGGIKCFVSLTNYDVDPDLYTKQMLMLSGSTTLTKVEGAYAGDLSGINVAKTPFWIRRTSKPGKEIASLTNWNDRIEEIAKNATKWNIGFLLGIPSWNQLMIERVLAVNKVEYIQQIWPNLRVFVHGGVAFEPYERAFNAMMRAPLIYIDTYLASEGFIAYQNRPDTRGMALLLNNGIFFEFIPFNEDNFDAEGNVIGNPKTLAIHEVSTGVDYALVISTCAGAWRYLIGDTIRFTDLSRCEIIITGRTKHFLSICGEHLSVDNMNQAVQRTQDFLDVNAPEYTVSAFEHEGMFAHKWYVGCDRIVDSVTFAKVLDEQLQKLNDDYRVERSAVLGPPQVHVIPADLFYQWLQRQGKVGGQYKFPRVMKQEQFAAWESFVKQATAIP